MSDGAGVPFLDFALTFYITCYPSVTQKVPAPTASIILTTGPPGQA